jgi:oxygen-dependent protoporphyrinogen oxidase
MRIAVIGGGIAGLTAARALVQAGHDVRVLEAADRAGGVVATTSVDGYVREHAASSFLGGPPHGAFALARELGIEVDKASARAKRRWIYIDAKLRALPANPLELVRSDLLTWRGKLDLIREPLRPSRPPGVDESVHAFATRRFGAEAARSIIAPFVTGIFAADSHEVSLEAGFPKLAALDAEGGLVRGLAKQMRQSVAARVRRQANGDNRKTPRGLYAPRGGIGALVAGLAATLGDRVQVGRRVTRLNPGPRGVEIDGEKWDGAVLAIPAELAAALVADHVPELAKRIGGVYRAPVAVAYLGFPEHAAKAASDGFGFLVAQGEDLRVLGVVFESVVWPGRAPAGHVLLRCIFGGGRDPQACDLPDHEIIEIARHDLSLVLGIDAAPTHASVVRHERGIAQYPVGHRDHVRAAEALARTQRLVLAGADYRGAGINDLCADAATVVAEVNAWS